MKKIMITIIAAALVCTLMASGVLAAEAGPQQQPPVIAAPQATDAAPAPAATITPSQTDTPAPASAPSQEESAKVIETPDGVLSINLPKDTAEWTVSQDSNGPFTLTNGTDRITIRHIANGDPLPVSQAPDEKYAEVFEVKYSTANEIFLVTGCVTDAQKMPAVRDAVCSFKVLKYDTLQKKEAPKEPEVREASETMYSTQSISVNVRKEPNTSCDVIGGIRYAEPITVTGYVVENGADTGWLRINFNGNTGYVHSSNFSTTQPPSKTGRTMDLYAPEGGGVAVTVEELADGRWIDSNGVYYTKASDTEYFDDKDNKWVLPEYFEDNPVGQIFTDFYQDMINESTGESVTVRLMTDGRYLNDATQEIFNMEGGGGPHMYGEDGSVLIFPDEYE